MNDPIPLKDLVEDAFQDLQNPRSRAFSKGGCLRIEREGREIYVIPWHEMEGDRGLLFWLCQLLSHQEMTRRVMGKVVHAIIRHRGFNR